MPVSSMKTIPYSDPGMLQGGVREHRAILNNLQADAFRSASQSQDTAQAARAFSGSDVTNAQTQTASLSQTATANNTKTVTIGAVEGTNAHTANFNFNYLQKYIAGADANDWLARGAANIAQDQGGDQSGFAKLEDFSGVDSDAANSLTQNGQVAQNFDVDLTATLSNTTHAAESGNAFQESRFRTIEANLNDQSAQAIFTSGQRQGSAGDPVSQVAVSDGGDVDNTVAQTATITQNANNVHLTGTFDLSVNETAALSPRTTDLFVRINELSGSNSAINSSAASQEQNAIQSGAGGVDEDGNVTENGGESSNSGTASASNQETTTVQNSISIQI
jgi:hypothetical protein